MAAFNSLGTTSAPAKLVARLGSAASQIAYTASKGGVLSMSRELGIEFAKRGVRVNALCPGPVDTPLLRTLFDPEQAARRLVHVPSGRFARAREIAEVVAFLASDASSYINASEFLEQGLKAPETPARNRHALFGCLSSCHHVISPLDSLLFGIKVCQVLT